MPEGGGKAERQRTQNVTYRTLSTIGQKLRRPVFFAHWCVGVSRVKHTSLHLLLCASRNSWQKLPNVDLEAHTSCRKPPPSLSPYPISVSRGAVVPFYALRQRSLFPVSPVCKYSPRGLYTPVYIWGQPLPTVSASAMGTLSGWRSHEKVPKKVVLSCRVGVFCLFYAKLRQAAEA